MKTTLTTVAALAGLFPAVAASEQDGPPAQQATVREALEALEREWDPGAGAYDPGLPIRPAVATLRQAFGPRPAAELDWLADRLAGMMADTTLSRDVRYNARSALWRAGTSDTRNYEGTPHPRAFDLLVTACETGSIELYGIHSADPERGPAYVRDLFERSERPAPCFRAEVWGRIPAPGDPPDCVGDPGETPWCRRDDLSITIPCPASTTIRTT